MSFTEKVVNVTVQLGQGSYGAGGFDTVKLTGYRVSANITKGADPTLDAGEIRIFNLSQTLMNQLSTLGKPPSFDRINQVSIEAGDASGTSLVYTGIIRDAFQDFSDAPNACLNITSNVGLVANAKPIPANTYTQQTDVATMLADAAARLTPACTFENNGVTGTLPPSYLPGTALQQLRKIAQAAHLEFTIDNGVVAAWPKGGARGGAIINIGPGSGLVGYPEFSGTGFVRLRSLYMPGLRLNGDINLSTSIGPAAGVYRLCALSYELDAKLPGGNWFANMQAYRPNAA